MLIGLTVSINLPLGVSRESKTSRRTMREGISLTLSAYLSRLVADHCPKPLVERHKESQFTTMTSTTTTTTMRTKTTTTVTLLLSTAWKRCKFHPIKPTVLVATNLTSNRALAESSRLNPSTQLSSFGKDIPCYAVATLMSHELLKYLRLRT